MPYQSFPGKGGMSRSDELLAALCLPPLAGKRFLDVGCNEGYFCGYAFFDAARRALGIDRDANAIAIARSRFPRCEFLETDWNDFLLENKENFDLILCASALRDAVEPRKLLAGLMSRLGRGGLLAVELATVENAPSGTRPGPDGGLYLDNMPDAGLVWPWRDMDKLFAGYAYKHMGPAPDHGPLAAHVFHVRNILPCAVLLMGAPGSGKTTAAKRLFAHLPVINGDQLLARAEQLKETCPRLAALMSQKISWQRLDLVVREIFATDALSEYVDLILAESGGGDFVFDGFIPEEDQGRFVAALEARYCRVLTLRGPAPEYSLNELSRRGRVEARKYQLFLGAYENTRKRCR